MFQDITDFTLKQYEKAVESFQSSLHEFESVNFQNKVPDNNPLKVCIKLCKAYVKTVLERNMMLLITAF